MVVMSWKCRIPVTSSPGEEPACGSQDHGLLTEAIVEMVHSDPFQYVQDCRESCVSFMRQSVQCSGPMITMLKPS